MWRRSSSSYRERCCAAGAAATSSGNASSAPGMNSIVLPSTTSESSCRDAASPPTTSRTRERAASGERKISISSLVAAKACERYSDSNALSAVGWPAFAPAFICRTKRPCVSSHFAGPPSTSGTGTTRWIAQSSLNARNTAESTTPSRNSSLSSCGDIAPFSFSVANTFTASGDTRIDPVVEGSTFHPLSPRSVYTNENACAEHTKSGSPVVDPSRFSGTAEPSAIMRASVRLTTSFSSAVKPLIGSTGSTSGSAIFSSAASALTRSFGVGSPPA